MEFLLPKIGAAPVALPHFPTRQQAFLFRAWEYIPAAKIASLLRTDEETIRSAATEMGLPDYDPGMQWLEKGYITIIRRLWHILPYSQLLELLQMDEQTFAFLLKEEDFLDHKLGDKPDCAPIYWRKLTEEEKQQTARIKKIMASVEIAGVPPFAFAYQVPKVAFAGESLFDTRIMYPFSGLYQHAFDVDSRTYLSDAQLEAYQNLGINGIWAQGVLSQLAKFPFDPTLSEGYEKRLERMQSLAQRLAAYGMKLYLYINEPRYMPVSFFEKYPHLKGHTAEDKACLCTSTPEVQNYLKDAIEEICRAVPDIGGFFTITATENMTNCYSHSGKDGKNCNCPRCLQRTKGEVIAQSIACVLEGAERVSKDIRVFAWSWAWQNAYEDIIRHLPKKVILLSQSEVDVPFEIGGVKGKVRDYSMSIPGPGERAKTEWAIAKECGLQIGAKIQVNTTWEVSTIPALPVAPSIEEHMQRLKEEGVRHLLLSWTVGGYPCANIAAAAKYFYEKCSYEPKDSSTYAAEKRFAEAFREFPFHIKVVYFGPSNAGPSTLLFEKSTGYQATMTCYAYDDLESWRGIYPVDVFEDQFKKLCDGWAEGMALLKDDDESETALMAHAADCIFRSCLYQIRFIRARDEGRLADAADIAEKELAVAEKMLSLMNKNAALGYEAANHYYYSKGQLAEKILNCHYIMEKFRQ